MPAVEAVGVAYQAAVLHNRCIAHTLVGRFEQRQQCRRGARGRDAAFEESHQQQIDQFAAQAFECGERALLLELAQGFEGIGGRIEHGGDALERRRLLRAQCLDAVLQFRDGGEGLQQRVAVRVRRHAEFGHEAREQARFLDHAHDG